MRSGPLYRSAELSKLTGDDASAFGNLGIRSVSDFRTEREWSAQPDVVPAGVEYVVLGILADSTNAAPAQILKVLGDPKGAANCSAATRRRQCSKPDTAESSPYPVL